MEFIELSSGYWNELAKQFILITALLAAFSITIIANLMVYDKDTRITNLILKFATVAVASFLISLIGFSKIAMLTTSGYPFEFETSDLNSPRLVSFIGYIVGIISISSIIGLSGWTKSKKTGIFTTFVALVLIVVVFVLSAD